jgi:predicted phage terminase large subunit-like protein
MLKVSAEAATEAWRFGIASYAAYASQGRKPWYPYLWVAYLAQRLYPSLMRGGARIIVNAPPRHGKSEIVSHWLPTWYIERFPYKQIILASYGGEFAGEWGKKVRDEFAMNKYCCAKLRTDSRAVESWMTEDGGGMKTAGIGGPITGRGANLVILDDVHKNWEEAMSPVARERVIDWFNSTLYTRLEPNASIIQIATRWHEADLSGFLMDKHEDVWELIRFPALSEGDGDVLGRVEGEALCPERFPKEKLENIKKVVGSHIFAGLYQQRPAPLLGGIVKRDWFRYWDELPKDPDEFIQTWDLTFKATGTSYAVGQVWCRKGANCYLIDQVRGKMDFLEQQRQLKVMWKRYPGALDKILEDAADAQAVKSALDATVPGIILQRASGSKEARLSAVAGAIESGNVYLPRKAEWLDDFLQEVTTFPGTVNDDQVDAMSLALDRLVQKSYDVNLGLPMEGVRQNPWESMNV